MKQILLLLMLVPAIASANSTYPDGRPVNCYCTDRSGNRIELGQTVCLNINGRSFMAQCQMSLNVPMWREIQSGCQTLSSKLKPQPVQDIFDTLAVHAHI
ncbi:MAG TPA: hypothetical protein ENH56_09365 [Roseobacter sp.]|nr:hypothetical protein [Roseobacter sp.]